MDFFDIAFTFSNHTSNVTCCHPNNTFEVATCGQGASCVGQCLALGATLCPSGECTDDPRTCDLKFRSELAEDEQRVAWSDLSWCTNSQHQCRVRKHRDCCYNPNCLKWPGRKQACSCLLSFLTASPSGQYQNLIFLPFSPSSASASANVMSS